MGIAYRPEIDGLRAIAVLGVVGYHAGLGGAGYVGVDVFFVISGYLITALLLKERAATGRIDLLGFYARRVRRIFPAAAFMVLAVLGASAVLLSPLQQTHTANSAGAALAFGANVFFQMTSGGYFDGPAEAMPLLHLWSLSVEEQFYFLWPALLLLAPRLRPALLVLSAASLLLAEYWIGQGSDAAFFQMPSRFWELAAGGLIAATAPRGVPRWLGAAGVALTLAACAVPLGRFPGMGALPAVLGACAVIAAIHGGQRNALLASRPMVAVGLISYSLYLWHWPILAFYRATSPGNGEMSIRLILCVAAVLLAAGSYRYIEQPFRRMRFRSGRTVAAGATLSAVLALSACGLGMATRLAPADLAAIDFPDRQCHALDTETRFPVCPTDGATVALWGDSMAYAWRPMLRGKVAQFTRDACQPLVGYLPGDMPRDRRCKDFNARAAEQVAGMDTLVLAGWWMGHDMTAKLPPTLDSVRGVRRVVIVGPSPVMRAEVPDCLRGNAECAVTRADFDAEAGPILAELRAIASRYPNVEVLDVTGTFCSDSECPPVRDGVPMYWDSHHVSRSAARSVALP